jgi:choline dehydrogenase-like flavoprotein
MNFVGFGEGLARYENHVTLDPEVKDAWDIPVLHIDTGWSDNERRMVEDMADTAAEMLEAMGAVEIERRADLQPLGGAIHEVGTARMGDDPKQSVVNRWQQAHDVRNLFVMDGSVYPSTACQNPTITIMALASRACDYLVEELRASRI